MASERDRLDEACEVMHDAYEQAAAEAGWSTNPDSRKPWADVPEANKAAMRAGLEAVLRHVVYVRGQDESRLIAAGDAAVAALARVEALPAEFRLRARAFQPGSPGEDAYTSAGRTLQSVLARHQAPADTGREVGT